LGEGYPLAPFPKDLIFDKKSSDPENGAKG